MTVQLGPVPPVAAGLQPNDTSDAREPQRAGIDRPPLSTATAETARAVDPPPTVARTEALPERDLPPLIPPDPRAPAGPPPAFEASILDRARQGVTEPEARSPQPEPRSTIGAKSDAAEGPKNSGSDAYAVPPSAEERAEVELATVRRIETPYDTATVDVSR